MNLSALTGEEQQLLRRLADLSEQAQDKYVPRFTSFLTERQAIISQAFAAQNRIEGCMAFGGYGQAARVVWGFFPPYSEPNEESFPIVPLTARFRKGSGLSHRDFLGVLMNMGIKREGIGDILVSDGVCILFALHTVSRPILEEFVQAGGQGVSFDRGFDPAQVPIQEYKEISGTVSSTRMDSLVRLLTGQAREKSAALLRAGLVRRNHAPADNPAGQFGIGDTLSIRGYGRYIVDGIGEPTKKGRLPVRCRKYL